MITEPIQSTGCRVSWKLVLSLCLALAASSCSGSGGASSQRTPQPAGGVDIVVYAATPSGIMAAIEAGHLGKEVVILEPSQHVGGMSSSGLGATDMYHSAAMGGLVKTFFATVHAIYGPASTADSNGTRYEPHIAEQTFLQMLGQATNVTLVYGAALASVQMSGTVIESVTTTDGSIYKANQFIDASYEGDLMAAAHVSYTVGRESSSQYSEPYAGVTAPFAIYDIAVDPYIQPGNPSSGLLPHVTPNTLPPPGSADKSVMAYNYRMCFSQDSTNQIPFPAPANYDPIEFEVLARTVDAAFTRRGKVPVTADFLSFYSVPNKKYDVNLGHLMSTDLVGGSAAYPDASPDERVQIAAEHKRYIQALLHFLTTDPRIPPAVRAEVNSLGLCKDEFRDNGGWPRQLYVREARRMIGAYVMTQHDAQLRTTIADPIGLGGFGTFDSHQTNRVDDNGVVRNEPRDGLPLGNHPYPIPYRILTPQASQATNLLVSVAVSASHVAFTTLRMEPTYMIMGQAAGAAASLAIDQNVSVQAIPYASLRFQLRADQQVLEW